MAAALGIDVDRVNVKATTEEHLGFTGDGSGMSAHAVALIEKIWKKLVWQTLPYQFFDLFRLLQHVLHQLLGPDPSALLVHTKHPAMLHHHAAVDHHQLRRACIAHGAQQAGRVQLGSGQLQQVHVQQEQVRRLPTSRLPISS